jgi:D-amino-acid dehydrogenase
MNRIAVIGAGITGVTTAHALIQRGYEVMVLDRHRYPAMETSFANGGQLSACNAEVWNSTATILKGVRWMLRKDAPLLMNPAPSWHKYSWIGEFMLSIRGYRQNTLETVRLAIEARRYLFELAEQEDIKFDLEKRGILHIFHDDRSFQVGLKVNKLLNEGGLERFSVAPDEIQKIEPALSGTYVGGFYAPSDATGDIHKFTRGLADVCQRSGVRFVQDANVTNIIPLKCGFRVRWESEPHDRINSTTKRFEECFDKVVICAGVRSKALAAGLGDRINIYPVKGYSITVQLDSQVSQNAAPIVSLLDEEAKIVTSRLGVGRFRVAGTAEFNGFNRDIRMDRIQPLINWVQQNFPRIETSQVVPWAGLRPMMPDMMPVVRAGKRPGIFYNTGHGHLGWTLSAITAQMVSDLLLADRR